MLQRARGSPLLLARKDSNNSGASTPKASEAAASVGTPSSESDVSDATRERDEQHDRWLENMRVIEELREYVRGRLERNDFVDENLGPSDVMEVSLQKPKSIGRELPSLRGGSSLYPILRMTDA
jgi:hypothetical protein